MDANSFHRLAKVLVDSGEVATLDEADATFSRYGVRIVLDPSVARDVSAQVIALTAINAASRSFRGNVHVVTPGDMMLRAPGFEGRSLNEFLAWVGVCPVSEQLTREWPVIHVGAQQSLVVPTPSIRPWANGWRFGIGGHGGTDSSFFAPSCVAAGGLAISEAFSILRRDNPYAGRRAIELSLWHVGRHGARAGEPPEDPPPVPGTWLVGLGHLGQAYAWTLGFMAPAANATLVLQDVDIVTKSTLSTSLLSTSDDIQQRKTRLVARWLETRGFKTAIVERRFDEFQRVQALEPRLALFGVDNAAARRVLEGAGFRFVTDAGLGSGYQDFRAIRVRTFPGSSQAATLWATPEANPDMSHARAYQDLLARGAEPCGVTTLATRSVGAPFVGCVAAAYVVAELLRNQIAGPSYAVIDMNLRDPQSHQSVIQAQ